MTPEQFLVIARRPIRDKFAAQGMAGIPEDVIDGLSHFALASRMEEGEPLDTFDWSKFHVVNSADEGINAIEERIATNATVH